MTASRQRRRRTTSNHPARRVLFQLWRLALSFGYLISSAMLMLFGYIAGWELDAGRPILGSLMIIAGLAVFFLGPRAIRRITGKDPIDPPPFL